MTERGSRKSLAGTVVSNKMEKTALILVERLTKHQIYGKYIRRRSKYMAHDPQNKCRIGDKVRIVESRPMSKRKRWQVMEILTKGNIED
ncbi:MAG: 30S ribosomal protein S17 [Verrucomicrobia bacterium]|jgi:small subunit ribosomal protein S17|nr:30S ribosomal protein S17 [Deltaproteobacteria bacterium]RKX40974.1 MAG: 30S ribosomal protein S17 [Verrucomicrobiota bacterium]